MMQSEPSESHHQMLLEHRLNNLQVMESLRIQSDMFLEQFQLRLDKCNMFHWEK